MPRIFDFSGRDVERSQTVAAPCALKPAGLQAAQVTAETADVGMVVCRAANVARVRGGSRRIFVTAALGFAEAVACRLGRAAPACRNARCCASTAWLVASGTRGRVAANSGSAVLGVSANNSAPSGQLLRYR